MLTVGVLGAGQLARMLALSAYPLGIKVKTYEPQQSPCAADVCPHTPGAYDDFKALASWLNDCDVVTYENENIPQATLEFILEKKPIHPNPEYLPSIQDRLFEKQLCRELSIPTVEFSAIASRPKIEHSDFSYPLIIKTRTLGYDGKGQYFIESQSQLQQTALPEVPLIAEEFIKFEREVSLMVASNGQQVRYYPLTWNVHESGILRKSQAPYVNPALQQQAQDIADKLISHANYQGVMGIEFFVVDEQLIVNEIAPRVHNSGHWTIDAAVTSQFENHLRGILNLPLGDTTPLCQSTMINCIGEMPKLHELAENPNIKVHDYQKQSRSGRKVGHYTLLKP